MESSGSDSHFQPPPSGQAQQQPPAQPLSEVEESLESLSELSQASFNTLVEGQEPIHDVSPQATGKPKRSATGSPASIDQVLHDQANDEDEQVGIEEAATEDDSDEDLERPNRFRGYPDEWKKFTEQERMVANSLDTIRATDLSVHLFNAFCLKSGSWQPRPRWTAWPLEPKFVPRSWNRAYNQLESIHRPTGARTELEEILIAHVTKEARERFFTRMRDDKEDSSVSPRSPSASNTSEELANEESDDDEPLMTRRDETRSDALQKKIPREAYPAMPQVDPDIGPELLRPSVRDIQQKFDRLLAALHRSRANTWRAKARRRSHGSESGVSDTTSRASSVSSNTRRSSSRVSESGRSEMSLASGVGSGDGTMQDPTEVGSITSTGPRRIRVNNRDWSDVLGLAAVTESFSPAVIERTRERCAQLFNQDMKFNQI